MVDLKKIYEESRSIESEKIRKLQDELDDFKTKYYSLVQDYELLNLNNKELKDKIYLMQEKLATVKTKEQTINELQDEIKSLDKKNEILVNKISHLTENVNELKNSEKSLKEELNKVNLDRTELLQKSKNFELKEIAYIIKLKKYDKLISNLNDFIKDLPKSKIINSKSQNEEESENCKATEEIIKELESILSKDNVSETINETEYKDINIDFKNIGISSLNISLTNTTSIPSVPSVPPVPNSLNNLNIPSIPSIPLVPGSINNINIPSVPSVPGSLTKLSIPSVPGALLNLNNTKIPGIPTAPGVPTIPNVVNAPSMPKPKPKAVPTKPAIKLEKTTKQLHWTRILILPESEEDRPNLIWNSLPEQNVNLKEIESLFEFKVR